MDEELPRPVRPLSIFSSYVDQDKELYDELEKHLSLLQREGTITIWDHRNIKAGANTKQVSSEQLEVAQIILLLISPDFLTSDAAYDEMQQALRRQKTDLAYVIPILLRPVDLKCTLFTDLQVLPRNSQPVTTWTDRDQAFAHIAKEIRLVVEQQQHVVTGSSIEPPTPPFAFVFISYARQDCSLAQDLRTALTAGGIVERADHQASLAGISQEERSREAIRSASAVILVATSHTRCSSSVKAELQIAEMYQRPIYVWWMQGNQVTEALPTGRHDTGRRNCFTFDARGEERHQEALQEMLQTFRKQTGHLHPTEGASSPLAIPRNPYKGLQAFHQKDATDFFGRDRLIDDLIEKVRQMLAPQPSERITSRLLTVVGASGSGKSSVVMAGLLPKLQQGALTDSQHWVYLDPLVPGQHPLEELVLTLSSLFPARPLKSIREDLADDSTRGLHLLLAMYARQTMTKIVLLVVDQCEELFTQTTTEEERRHFLDLLLTAVTEPDSPLIAVLTLRADFYDRPLQYPELGQLIQAQQVTTYPLSTQELRAVIEQPALLPDVQLAFAEDLVGDLLFEVRGQPGALPLLQFTLDQLFQRRKGHILTRQAYLEIGGVQGALANHAEQTYKALPDPDHQRLARALFLRLINPGTIEQDATKRRVRLSELTFIDPKETEMLAKVTADFIQARLLSTNTVHDIPTVEVSHEALISAWKDLAKWLDQGRDSIRLQQEISKDAAMWIDLGEPADQLYLDSELKKALEWRQANIPNLDEDRFLQASLEHQKRTKRRNLLVGLLGLIGIAGAGWTVYTHLPPTPPPPKALPYTYMEHHNAVSSAAWSPDGKRIASASFDRTVHVWDADSGTFVFSYKRHDYSVYSVAWSPDGKRIASAADDRTVHVWNADNGDFVFSYKGHTNSVYSVAWSPDGNCIASASYDRTVHVWDANDGNRLVSYEGHTGWVDSVAWSPDGKQIASASYDHTVHVWDANNGNLRFTYKGHGGLVHSVAWSPNGKHIASAGIDHSVHVWDANNGNLRFTYDRHASSIYGVAWSPDSKRIASASYTHSIHIWDANNGNLLFTYKGHASFIYKLAWSPNGKRIASTGFDHTVHVWDASISAPVNSFKEHDGPVLSVAWSPDGKRIASASDDKTVRVWSDKIDTPLLIYKGHTSSIYRAAWSPDSKHIASASADGTVQVWDASPGTPLIFYWEHADRVRSVAWSPDGQRIASASYDSTIHIWDANNGNHLLSYRKHTHWARSVAWSPDSKRIASASMDRSVHVWDADNGNLLFTYTKHTNCVNRAEWSPDGKRIASASYDSTVHVWDADNGTLLFSYKGHTDSVLSLAWSPDGERIASASSDQTVRVWGASLGTPLFSSQRHSHSVLSLAWSPDGKRIATAGDNSTVLILEI